MYNLVTSSRTTVRKLRLALTFSCAGIALLINVTVARADNINLIVNGTFTQTTLTNSGQITFNPPYTQVADWWTTTGVTLGFLYFPGTQNAQLADQFTAYGTDYFQLYQGITNTIPSSPPGGGNFIAVDADPSSVGSFIQTVNGLVPGAQYQLTFYQAGAQQAGYTGPTTEQWKVSLGSQTIFSALMMDASKDFVPWEQQTLTFTATNTSEYLTFMALGTPDGLPPAVLLADVSLVAPGGPASAPEPSTMGMFAFGSMGLLFLGARIRNRQS